MLKRVVVTGLGVLAPNGNNIKSFWDNIVKGRGSMSKITRFDPDLFRTHFAAQLHDYNPVGLLEHSDIKRTDLFTQYALIASDQAIKDSGFDFEKMNPFDVG